jgi:hypothetical protein
MATNNNKPLDMKQLWQQMEPCISASAATSAMTACEDGNDRYLYYLIGGLFYRYDLYGNTWHKLAAPLYAPTVLATMRYSKFSGNYGKVISVPAANKLRIAGVNAGIFTGYKIRIIAGKGAGQVRTVTDCAEPVKYDQGLATTAAVNYIGDSTKKWKPNQWVGYQVRLTYSTGMTQVRKIMYNDTTTVYVSDTNHQPFNSFNNFNFVTAPVITAGSQTHFVIEASDITVDSAWTVTPDYTSQYRIESGGIWMFTSYTVAPFGLIQYYDIATDTWAYKTVPSNFFLAAVGTDATIERTGEVGGIYQTGTATSGASYKLTDTSKTLEVDRYANYRIRITGGTGVGQSRRIICNGTNYFEVARSWNTNPDATSTYEVVADRDKIYIGGNGQAAIYQYDIDSDLVLQGSKYDDGIANLIACNYAGIDTPVIGINSGTRATGGVTAVSVNAGGTGYLVGDILTLSTTGTNAKVIVTSTAAGVINGISLLRVGSGYSAGSSSTTGGTGSGATVTINTVGTVCNVTTLINHNFQIGEQVVLSGDANYAGTVTIIGCDNYTNFDIATSAAASMSAAASQGPLALIDCTKNWVTNEHAGKMVQCHLVGTSGVVTPRLITSNTATTLNFATIGTAPVNGTGRYVIINGFAFGRDEQYKTPAKANIGHATGGSTTTLIDSSKNWNPNQWAGARIRIQGGTGRDSYFTITSNTATTLTYSTQTFTPDATTHYHIQDTWGICSGAGSTTTIVDSTKTWAVNQWAGKRLRITGGAGFGLAAAYNEVTITSNTSNTLTFAAVTGLAPDATTTYTILGIPVRGAGIELIWAFGGVSNGRYMYYPRGTASNTLDRYDVTKETWEYSFLISPQTDTMTTGTYWAYDGVNRIYFSPGVAVNLVQYVYYLDLTNNKVYGFGSVPQIQSAPVIGNRMEIVNSPQGLQYLYHVRNSNYELYRALIYF